MNDKINEQLQNGLFQYKVKNSKRNSSSLAVGYTYKKAHRGLSNGANIALLLGSLRIVVVDIDSREAEEFAINKGLHKTLIEQTTRGYHFFYKIPEGITHYKSYTYKNGLELKCTSDTNSRLDIMIAPSRIDDVVYTVICDNVITTAPEWVLKRIKRSEYARRRAYVTTEESIRDILGKIEDYDDYDVWIQTGMAIHNLMNASEEGFELWIEWASNSVKFNEYEHIKLWEAFDRYDGDDKVGFKRLKEFSVEGD